MSENVVANLMIRDMIYQALLDDDDPYKISEFKFRKFEIDDKEIVLYDKSYQMDFPRIIYREDISSEIIVDERCFPVLDLHYMKVGCGNVEFGRRARRLKRENKLITGNEDKEVINEYLQRGFKTLLYRLTNYLVDQIFEHQMKDFFLVSLPPVPDIKKQYSYTKHKSYVLQLELPNEKNVLWNNSLWMTATGYTQKWDMDIMLETLIGIGIFNHYG